MKRKIYTPKEIMENEKDFQDKLVQEIRNWTKKMSDLKTLWNNKGLYFKKINGIIYNVYDILLKEWYK